MEKSDKKMQELIAAFLNAEISKEKLQELEQCAKNEGVSLKDFVSLYQNLEYFEVPETSNQMDDKFYAMLQNEKRELAEKSSHWKDLFEYFIRIISVPQVPRLAYGFILLLIGLLLGNLLMPNRAYEMQISSMSQEVSQMRQLMVLSLIEGNQATDRIKAVNYVSEMKTVDNKVIDALFKTLNNDKNINVRLVSLEALVKFANMAYVRHGLIKSIQQQDSPIILSSLAEILIQFQDKQSKEELENLLKKEDLDPTLRLTIESGMRANI